MNKAEMARQLARQTTEQERNLEMQRRRDFQRVFQELESLTQDSGTMIKNQKVQEDSLKSHSGLLTQVKQDISELMKEQIAMRKSQKKLQVIWILNFLFDHNASLGILGGIAGIKFGCRFPISQSRFISLISA
jgi:hypothetical protein